MINLLKYDNVNDVVDKTKTWFYKRYKTICSREIKFKYYYFFKKRYNPLDGTYTYYIILTDVYDNNQKCYKTIIDDYGRIKLKCNNIFKGSRFDKIHKDVNINLILIEEDKETIVYEIDL